MSIEVRIKKNLKGFALDVEFRSSGGRTGILGASGSGKSMTLKCIAGIETPDEGYIAVNGRVLFDSERHIDVRPQKRRVGYLFQDYALFPNMTVWENLACGVRPSARQAERRAKITEMLDICHLTGLEDRYPSQLSGGQQQRVALARILVHEPDVVLLDEPFSSLDAHLSEQMQVQLLEVLRNFRNDAILVTHDRNEAYRICAQLMAMDEGRILARGDTGEVFRNPKYLKVALLTGCENISRAVKRGDFEVTAIDWGLLLKSAAPVPDDTVAVGIHAHDFKRVAGSEMDNRIRIKVLDETEGPFERSVVFRGAGEEGAGARESLRWTFTKEAVEGSPPEYLYVHPERVLLLR